MLTSGHNAFRPFRLMALIKIGDLFHFRVKKKFCLILKRKPSITLQLFKYERYFENGPIIQCYLFCKVNTQSTQSLENSAKEKYLKKVLQTLVPARF